MAREAICTRDKDGLNSANVGVKDSTRDLSSHVYVESWWDRVRVPHMVSVFDLFQTGWVIIDHADLLSIPRSYN